MVGSIPQRRPARLARVSLGTGHAVERYGMSAANIQSIPRHANIATTLGYYVFPNAEKTKGRIEKLAEAVRKTYKVKV
jgi:hypothetical protein